MGLKREFQWSFLPNLDKKKKKNEKFTDRTTSVNNKQLHIEIIPEPSHPDEIFGSNQIENQNSNATQLLQANIDMNNKNIYPSPALVDDKHHIKSIDNIIGGSFKIKKISINDTKAKNLEKVEEERSSLLSLDHEKINKDNLNEKPENLCEFDNLNNNEDKPGSSSLRVINETNNEIRRINSIKLRERYTDTGCLLLPDDTFRVMWDFVIIV